MARIPFYGRGPAPQIARMDMQAATAPGRNWGAAFESIGQTVGQAVEKHRENKKAKKKERDFIDAFEARISKNPGFAESYGINSDDTEEIRLTGKTIYNSPEMRPVIQDFSRFQEKERARAGTTEYLDLMLPSQAETVEPSDSGIRDFFAQARATDEAAGLASVQSPSAFAARLEGMPIESPEAKELVLGRQLGLQKAKEARDISDQAREIAQSNAMFANQLKLNKAIQEQTEFSDKQNVFTFKPEVNSIGLGETNFGIEGKFGNEVEALKLKGEDIPNYNAMNAVFSDLLGLGEQRKTETFMSNADKAKAVSLVRQLQGLLREDILGPGTVTDSERAILDIIIQNPTKWWSASGTYDEKMKTLKGLRKKAFNKLKNKITGMGLTVSEFGKGGGASSPQTTSSGNSYEEISLDEL